MAINIAMNFKEFRNSNFFKLGMSRINSLTLEPSNTYFSMFDCGVIDPLSTIQNTQLELEPPMGHNNMTTVHLLTALQTQLPARHGIKWIPEEFKELLYQQCVEVNTIVNNILETNNRGIPTVDQIGMIHSKMLITEPGVSINKHIHQSPFTLTVCYAFEEDRILRDVPSHFIMGEVDRQLAYYPPDIDKFYFTMLRDPPHEVVSNEWRFWWFNDFSREVEIPDLGFHRWDSPLLDNRNLDSTK